MSDGPDIRIVLADSHGESRDCLYALLASEDDMETVAEALDGEATVRLASELDPDVLVMDTDMPDLSGMEVIRRVVSVSPGVKVVAVSLHSDSRFAVRMLESGAFGYVLKNRVAEDLSYAVRAVASSHTYVSPGIAGIAQTEM